MEYQKYPYCVTRCNIDDDTGGNCPDRLAAAKHGKSFTCPVCLMTSSNWNDIQEGYCGYCHDWTREVT